MKTIVACLGTLALTVSALAYSDDALACGGCFNTVIQQGEASQVTGHRMIFSVSNDATTLWDQITYSGAPETFAWVLPINGLVEIGLSSDALFEQLEQYSSVYVSSPQINCPPVGVCIDGELVYPGVTSTATTTSTGGGVTVIAQETVGPYETAQLSSSDPLALEAWLDSHGYEIPADVVPVIDAYVADGFDFLVMKLVPGKDVTSMRPVRVTAPGAGLGLPLRMVAAGTGAITPITLWVAAEGRYEPANFPWFTIDPDQVVWNWDTQSSNYKQLKQAGFDSTNGKGWLIESATSLPKSYVGSPLLQTAEFDPDASGYGSDMVDAKTECQADLDTLYGTLAGTSLWLTRMHAELPKSALGTDLQIQAAGSQATINPYILCKTTVGTAPTCPQDPPCGDGGSSGTSGGGSDGDGDAQASGGCALGGGSDAGIGAALAVLWLAIALRRARRQS